MKNKLLAAVLVLAALLCLMTGVALAETDPIVCSMEISPDTLTQPGTVKVTITVSNSGDTDMKDPLILYDPVSTKISDFGTDGSATLKAGETITWTGDWEVNQRTLENGTLVYFAKYTLYNDSGESYSKSQPIRGTINSQVAEVAIDVKRTISPGSAREGQSVTIKYDITNAGSTTLTNISLKENKAIKKDAITVAKELKSGQTAQVTIPVTMGKKDLTSEATVTYTTADSSKKQTETVEAQVIKYGEPSMTAKLTSDVKGAVIDGTVKLTLVLKNSGTVDYSDIRVTDPTLGDVFTNQQLAQGASLTLEKEITLAQTTEYLFTITAIDNTGTEVSLATDPLTLTAIEAGQELTLTVTAKADRTEVYEQPGIVRFNVTVQNDSAIDATKVDLYHGATKIYTFESIPAGETRSLTRDAALSMAGKYQFTAATVDALGNSVTFPSNEIQIAFSIPTAAPATATPLPDPTAEPTYQAITVPPISSMEVGTVPKYIRMFFYPLMIVCIVLLVIAAALLLVATKKRHAEKKASEAALDHLDRVKRRDYVAPNEEDEKPVREEDIPTVLSEDAQEGEVELPHMKYVRNAYERTTNDDADAYQKSVFDDEAYQMYDGTRDLPDPVTTESERSAGYEDALGYGDEAPYGDSADGYQDTVYDNGYGDSAYADGAADGYDDTATDAYDDSSAYATEPTDDYEASVPAAYAKAPTESLEAEPSEDAYLDDNQAGAQPADDDAGTRRRQRRGGAANE